MGEVIDAAAHRAEELLVAALERAEMRREAEVPLADERGGVARVAQERGQRRMSGRQVRECASQGARDRLVCAAAQAVLPAPGREREARRRAHGRVGVAVGEHARRRRRCGRGWAINRTARRSTRGRRSRGRRPDKGSSVGWPCRVVATRRVYRPLWLRCPSARSPCRSGRILLESPARRVRLLSMQSVIEFLHDSAWRPRAGQTPCQSRTTKSGKPCLHHRGTSFSASLRCPVTASARNLPVEMCGIIGGVGT